MEILPPGPLPLIGEGNTGDGDSDFQGIFKETCQGMGISFSVLRRVPPNSTAMLDMQTGPTHQSNRPRIRLPLGQASS
jgi:hypothetical protein